MKHDITKQKQLSPFVQAVIISLIILMIITGLVGVLAYTTGTINAEKAPPSPQDYQWSIYWGETGHILCYESSTAKEQGQPPSGILNLDITGSGVVTVNCRPPGTDQDGQ